MPWERCHDDDVAWSDRGDMLTLRVSQLGGTCGGANQCIVDAYDEVLEYT